jgi:pimeloyl-ACP methyl ester carboxylesterase
VKLVLLHAFPLDERMWEPQHAVLSGRDVYAPSLYGLGASMDEWARQILAEIDGEFVAVGASMGGYCALALARAAPDRIRRLMLIGARAEADPPERRKARNETIELIRQKGTQALWDDLAPKLFVDPLSSMAEVAYGIINRLDPEALVIGAGAMRDRADATNVIDTLACPVDVAVGEHDAFFSPEEARALANRAAEGKSFVFEDSGHLPSLERFTDFNRYLVGFLAGV